MTTDKELLAFPAQFFDERATGMTLGDYFASKAMQSMCDEVSRYDQFEKVAKDAYKMADAMLTARALWVKQLKNHNA